MGATITAKDMGRFETLAELLPVLQTIAKLNPKAFVSFAGADTVCINVQEHHGQVYVSFDEEPLTETEQP